MTEIPTNPRDDDGRPMGEDFDQDRFDALVELLGAASEVHEASPVGRVRKILYTPVAEPDPITSSLLAKRDEEVLRDDESGLTTGESDTELD